MLNLRELIKRDYKAHQIVIDEKYLDGIMANPERVEAFKKILKSKNMEVCA